MPAFLIKKKYYLLSVLFIVFCTTGCSYKLGITPFELHGTKPIFMFSKPIWTSPVGDMNTVQLNSFKIVEKKEGKWDHEHPLWAFKLPPGATLTIESIRYSVLPPGYAETDKAKDLSRGVTYLAIANSAGSGGSVEFSLNP